MKKQIIPALAAILLAGCDARITPLPAEKTVEKNSTTIVNPPAKEEKVENKTIIVNPPGSTTTEEKKTKTTTTDK